MDYPPPLSPLVQALKRYSSARGDWEAILLLKPDDGKALEKQASLFVQEGRIDAAVAAYESLIASGRAGAKQAEMQQTLQTLRNCLGAMQVKHTHALLATPPPRSFLHARHHHHHHRRRHR